MLTARSKWILVLALAVGSVLPGCRQEGSRENRQETRTGRAKDAGIDPALAKQMVARLDRIPDDPKLLESTARLLSEDGRIPEAIKLLKRLQSLQPDRCDLMKNLAEAFLELEDEEAAFEYYRACLKVEPNDKDSLFTLGGMLASHHPDEPASLKEGIALWERFLAAAGDDQRTEMVKRALPRIKQRLESTTGLSGTDGGVKSP